MPKQSKGKQKVYQSKDYNISNQMAKGDRKDRGKGDMIYNSALFRDAVEKERARLGFK